MQSAPQSIPAGALVTVPVPVPSFVTSRTGLEVNFAVTVLAKFMVTTQVPVRLVHAPSQPAKKEVPLAVAVSVMLVIRLPYASVQSLPQLIPPPVLLATVPLPVPVFVTVSTGLRTKLARTDFAASIVTLQVTEVPEQAPPQPVKRESGFTAAVRVTCVLAL